MSNVSVKLGENRYGKENVRMMRVIKDSPRHEVHEFKAQMLLEGDFAESYTEGSNKNIIATDTQKNTLYALSKKYPVEPIEEWAINISKDMLSRFSHVSAVNIDIDEYPWERIRVNGVEHNHAFQRGAGGIRFCNTRLARSGDLKITSGFKDLQVMKTTQSGFEGYMRDEYTTLKETKDRIVCTKVLCSWTYNSTSKSVNYSKIFDSIRETTINVFSGDPKTGTYSPSVQQIIYDVGAEVLKKYSEIEKISFVLPNIHYFLVDFNAFKSNLVNNNEVFFTADGAAGHIEGTVVRNTGVASKAKL